MDEQANRLAHFLCTAGVRSGDRVVIHLDNSPEAAIALFAVLKAGGVFVVLHPTTKADKLASLLEHSEARALITDRRKLAASGPSLDTLRQLALVYVVDGHEAAAVPTRKPIGTPPQLPGDLASAAAPPHRPRIDIDLAALIYTSGTTGSPKGVMMTHANMVAVATSIIGYLQWQPDEIVLSASAAVIRLRSLSVADDRAHGFDAGAGTVFCLSGRHPQPPGPGAGERPSGGPDVICRPAAYRLDSF